MSQQLTLRSLENMRNQQASSLAYFDVFWFSAAVAVGLVFLVLLMHTLEWPRRVHIGGEVAENAHQSAFPGPIAAGNNC